MPNLVINSNFHMEEGDLHIAKVLNFNNTLGHVRKIEWPKGIKKLIISLSGNFNVP